MDSARSSPASLLQLTAAVVLAVWRFAAASPPAWWRDAVLITSIFWIWTSLRPKSPQAPMVAASVMAYLLGIYVLGALPPAMGVLGPAR